MWEALLGGLASVLEFLGLEALADRIATSEEPRDPRNFPPPR